MKHNLFKSILAAAAFLMLGACVTDEQLVENCPGCRPITDSGDKVKLELFTRVPDYTPPPAADPATRMGSAQEQYVDMRPWVLVFKGDTPETALYVETVQAIDLGGERYVELTKQSSKCYLLILANSLVYFTVGPINTSAELSASRKSYTQANFDACLKPAGNPLTLTMACDLLHTDAFRTPQETITPIASVSDPKPLLPMSGMAKVPDISADTEVGTAESPLGLTRTLAKVVVRNTSEDFVLEAVGLVNAPRRSWLHRYGSTLRDNSEELTAYRNSTTSISTIAPAVAFTEGDVSGQTTASNPMYVFESRREENTCVVIQGKYKGATTSSYYKLAFLDPDDHNPLDGQDLMDVLRNYEYTFNIASVLRNGYQSLADATAAQHASNEDIVWEVAVNDASGYSLVNNGEYYLGVSNKRVIVHASEVTSANALLAFTISTNRTTFISSNSIKASSGITLVKGSTQIPSEKFNGSTVYHDVFFYFGRSFTTGTITVLLGDLEQVIHVEKRDPLPGAPEYVMLDDHNYVRAEKLGGDWLRISNNPEYPMGDYVNQEGGPIYLHLDPNVRDRALSNPPPRPGGHVMLGPRDETQGNIRVHFHQLSVRLHNNSLDVNDDNPICGGTFHRASEMGERLISFGDIGGTFSGDWYAKVIHGEDFIVLGEGWRDGGAGWPYNDTNAEAHPVEGNAKIVRGIVPPTGGEPRFRIGLTSRLSNKNPDYETKPRYGVVMFVCANGTRIRYVYVRQGEAADYLIPPSENPSADNLPFMPLNLTAEGISNESTIKQIALYGHEPAAGQVRSTFTDYPSQGGALFQYASNSNPRYAYHPFGSRIVSTSIPAPQWIVEETAAYDPSTMETCPEGYRRPDGNMTSGEFQETLLPTKRKDPGGYVADGYFDRHQRTGSAGYSIGGPGYQRPGTIVSVNNADAAYTGMFFANEDPASSNYGASIFLPFEGGLLARDGRYTYTPGGRNQYPWSPMDHGYLAAYWASGAEDALGAARIHATPSNANEFMRIGSRADAVGIRCVKADGVDKVVIPPPPDDDQPATPVGSPLASTFFGAFWRDDQTGERIITIPVNATNAGHWTAQVYSYGIAPSDDNYTTDDGVTTEFKRGDIMLSTTLSADPLMSGSKNPAQWTNPAETSASYQAESFQVSGSDMITGYAADGDMIYFRIGLRTKWKGQPGYNAVSNPARYAVIRLSYAGKADGTGFRHQLIFLRQGHEADYLYPKATERNHEYNVKFTTYNLTAPSSKMADVESQLWTTLDPKGGAWTKYPTQAGAFFQSVPQPGSLRRAFNPIPTSSISGFPPVSTAPLTDYNAATMETCPDGYRRPTRLSSEGLISSTTLATTSDLTYSLTPDMRDDDKGYVFGFYADGYFDRMYRSVVAVRMVGSGANVAYNGGLFYNLTPGSANYGASIFFPASGRLQYHVNTASTTLENNGVGGYYWSGIHYVQGVTYSPSGLWVRDTNGYQFNTYAGFMDLNSDGSVTSNEPNPSAWSIRCVQP